VEKILFIQCSTCLVTLRFGGHVPRYKNINFLGHYVFQKLHFWASKAWLSIANKGEKTCSSTLNIMILKMIKHEGLRICGLVEIQVGYKIM
jgi:hypothetical protein